LPRLVCGSLEAAASTCQERLVRLQVRPRAPAVLGRRGGPRRARGVRRAEQRGVRARRGRARDQGQLRELDVSVCALVHVHGVRSADQEVRAVRRMAGARHMLVPSGTGRRHGQQQKGARTGRFSSENRNAWS
jgi:hypothetical protein